MRKLISGGIGVHRSKSGGNNSLPRTKCSRHPSPNQTDLAHVFQSGAQPEAIKKNDSVRLRCGVRPFSVAGARVREDYFDTRVPGDTYRFSKYICAQHIELRRNR